MDPKYKTWLEDSAAAKAKTSAFLTLLKTLRKQEFLLVLKQTHTEVFGEVDCLACAHCCKTSPPLVTKNDVNRIAKHLGITPREFGRKYVIEDINGELSFNAVPCRFLADDNRCTIYDVRPEACRRYPHTDEEDFAARKSLNLSNALICPAAYRIILLLEKRLNLHP